MSFRKIALFLLAPTFPMSVSANQSTIKPGQIWPDTDGHHINAHGGGITLYNGNYYWFGESRGVGSRTFDGISCYRSADLINWHHEGTALELIVDEPSLLEPGCVVERPKVLLNEKTGKFVMWFHHELKGQKYKAALTGVAVADKITGPYRYLRSLRPNANQWPVNFSEAQKIGAPGEDRLKNWTPEWREAVRDGMFVRRDFAGGQMARDMTVFKDNDGTAWHIASSEENATLHFSKLTVDYLDFTGIYYRFKPGEWNESPAVLYKNSKYFLIASDTTGWTPNPARLFVADSLTGEWESLGNPCRGTKAEVETTFGSQGTFLLNVEGKKDLVIYMGDRWQPTNLGKSPYVWLPLEWEDGNPVIKWKAEWAP